MSMQWTPENDFTLREMFDAGCSDREIGQRLGCGSTSVENRRKRIGLRRPFGSQVKAPDAPTDRYPTGPEIDALFRAAEAPSKSDRKFRRLPPPTLVSNGTSMT